MKAKLLFTCFITLVILASCSAPQSLKQTDTIDDEIEVISNEIDSEYLEWVLNEKRDSGENQYNIQIPKLNIDSYVARCINEEIESRFLVAANNYLTAPDLNLYIETEYYISDEVISIKILQQDLPNYGTDGEIYTVNYSIKHDTILPFSYAVKAKNTTYQALQDEICKAYSDRYYEYMDASTFYINKDGEIVIVVIALEHPQECETWKHIYFYKPTDIE